LLEAREKLASLLTYMDGKAGAEELIKKIVQDRPLLEQLSYVDPNKNNDLVIE